MNTLPFSVIASIIGIFILYIICRIFIRPIKWALRLLLSCGFGLLGMVTVNLLFSAFGTIFAINPLTIMISGVLGLPGMIATFILQGIL